MSDLISRSALIAEINRIGGHLYSEWETAGVLSMAERIPAVDAVKVVRCKDCIHWNKDALACDTLPWVNSAEHANWYADDFCSYGERRSDGTQI